MTTYLAQEVGYEQFMEGGHQFLTDAPLDVGDTIVFTNTEAIIYEVKCESYEHDGKHFELQTFILQDDRMTAMRYQGVVRAYCEGERIKLTDPSK